jgi:hypothetical protein
VKDVIEAQWGIPSALQRLLDGHEILSDDEDTVIAESHLTFVLDESPYITWDVAGNPDRSLIKVDGYTVTFENERHDYVNVITQAPIRSGVHFFEFIMHELNDEQWCGLTANKNRAGYRGSSAGWFYYSGRRWGRSVGALHAPNERAFVKEFAKVQSGDVVGMLVNMELGTLVFILNNILQGSCRVPKEPLYLTTSVDVQGDRVELRKSPIADAPKDAHEALCDVGSCCDPTTKCSMDELHSDENFSADSDESNSEHDLDED